ncbi:hypothetical protein D3C75_1329020 [compost metagenome]
MPFAAVSGVFNAYTCYDETVIVVVCLQIEPLAFTLRLGLNGVRKALVSVLPVQLLSR